jgi:hypothetical protein
MEGFEEQAYGKQGGEDENEREESSGGGGSCSSGAASSGNGQEEDFDEKDVLVLDSRNCEENYVCGCFFAIMLHIT